MILPMKKVSLICLSSEKVNALEELRKLGVMHVELDAKVESHDFFESEKMLASAKIALAVVSEKKGTPSEIFSKMNGKEIVNKIIEVSDTKAHLEKKLDALVKDREKLLPWGEFSTNLISELRENGIHVYLCAGNKDVINNLPKNVSYRLISQDKGKIYFAVISSTELMTKALPIMNVPMDKTLREFDDEIADCKSAIGQNVKDLDSLSCEAGRIETQLLEATESIEFILNRNGMASVGEISYIKGYVPTHLVDALRAEAKRNGWGLLITDPHHDDKVPTMIKIPKIFMIAKPIFDFIGIAPSYHEVDISVCFLFFFTLFFGMLIGDAGYALLMMAALAVAKFKLRNNEKAKLPINLMFVLAASTFIWGTLIGSFFGIERHYLPFFLQGFDWMKSDENVRFVCFFIAALHLSIAHAWLACIGANKIRIVIGQIGWIMFIWGNFFLACSLVAGRDFPQLAYYLYIIGFVMMMFAINFKDIGDVCGFPFAVVSSFTDLLSYIRLFAVGLAAIYVAENFNKIGENFIKDGFLDIPYAGLVIGVGAIIFGHVLNMMLGGLAVLVHGIRLNTLEFSGQLGLHWSGFLYKPFKKTDTETK
ncbi:MAG TPA: hypothetical protein DCZ94_10785 [Lentisphaeria bacterium]|nr:MAG: hypothetical protein A2X48_06665 [Lentisphaerae bacterium GWF2_49_21]HBC87430.1 hypothetical protein [Lentisphaeria bacterium]